MFEKVEGIVLNTIKYSDKNSIAHVLTKERGRMAFLLSQSQGKIARMRRALFIPLSLVEIETIITPGREIHSIKECRSMGANMDIICNPIKNAIGMFIAEMAGKVIKGNEDNGKIYDYIKYCIRLLDDAKYGVANFHIAFLYHLGAYLGIQPDTGSYVGGYAFDMNDGVFVPQSTAGPNILPQEEAFVLMQLSRITFTNMNLFKFNRTQRNRVLDSMLHYYNLHNSTLGSLKSPDILKQLFD